jgi:hypothetical protein
MLSPSVPYQLFGPRYADWTLYRVCTYWEHMFVKKITLHICASVARVLLFRINNIILTTSSGYHCGSRRQWICRCSRYSLSILTNVLFIGEFLAKSNAKLSFSDSSYSKMSCRKFWLTTLYNTIYGLKSILNNI